MKRGTLSAFITYAVKVGELTGNKGPVAGMVLKKYADKLDQSLPSDEKYKKAFENLKGDFSSNKSKVDGMFATARKDLAEKKKNRKPRKSKK